MHGSWDPAGRVRHSRVPWPSTTTVEGRIRLPRHIDPIFKLHYIQDRTECFDCVPKPTPKSFPVCTIRSTPSQPIHCIVWAKSYLLPCVSVRNVSAHGTGIDSQCTDNCSVKTKMAALNWTKLRNGAKMVDPHDQLTLIRALTYWPVQRRRLRRCERKHWRIKLSARHYVRSRRQTMQQGPPSKRFCVHPRHSFSYILRFFSLERSSIPTF